MSTPWTTENLNDYLDDRLSSDERTRLEALVRRDRAAIEKLRELRRIRAELQSAPRFQLAPRFTQRVIDRLPDMYRDHDPANLAGLDEDATAPIMPSPARSTWQVAIGLIATLAASLLLVIFTSPPLREPSGVASNAGDIRGSSDDQTASSAAAAENDAEGTPVVPSGVTARSELDPPQDKVIASSDRSPDSLPEIAQTPTNFDTSPASEQPGIATSQSDSGVASTDPRTELPADGGEAPADSLAFDTTSHPPLASAGNADNDILSASSTLSASPDSYDRLVVVRVSTDAYQTAFSAPPLSNSNSTQIAESSGVEVSRFHLNQQPGALTAPSQATTGETAEAAPSSTDATLDATSEAETEDTHPPVGDEGLSSGQTRFVLVEATPEELETLLDDLHATTGALKQADATIALRPAAVGGAVFNATPLQFQPDAIGFTTQEATDGTDSTEGTNSNGAKSDGAKSDDTNWAGGEKESDVDQPRLRYLIVVVLSDA